MDKDLAWPLAGIGASALAGAFAAAVAGQPLTALAVVLLSLAAAGSMVVAWRRAAGRLGATGDRLSELLDPARRRAPEGRSVEDHLDRLDRAAADLRAGLDERGKELAKSAANLQALLDGLGEPVVATGEHETILLCNRAAETMTGVPPGGLAGLRFREVFTRPELLEMHGTARAGRATSRQVRITTPEGVRTFEVSATPLPAAWGSGIYGAVVFMRDVTSLAQAVQMRSDFVANASHELKTPLASLMGFIETLRGPAEGDLPAQRRFLAIMHEQAERMRRLLDDLLSLSRIEMAEHAPPTARVSLAPLLRRAADGFEPRVAARGQTLDLAIEPDLPEVAADADQLAQVFGNLLENAVKYGREGGVVRLAARRTAAGGRQGVAIAVGDDGSGIAPEHLPRLTERFYRVDAGRSRAIGGTGLGLA
ncbi:MAG: PAS domain-containing protein, partial [Phycisphaeraceae bacterium]|nr:PAS domain-containing protein [Phycisphaeraceae bacterium]